MFVFSKSLSVLLKIDCVYQVTFQEMEYRAKGGDPLWLKGLQYIPAKIYNLLQLNKMLCHQPWYITEKHFEVYNDIFAFNYKV